MSDVNKRPISDVNTHIWVFSGPHGMTYTTFGTHVKSHAGIFRCVSHCNADGFHIFVTDMAVAPIHKFLGGQNFLWRRKKFLLRSHAKHPVSSPPILKSFHVLKDAKSCMRVHNEHWINKTNKFFFKYTILEILGGGDGPPCPLNWRHWDMGQQILSFL